VGLTVPSLDSIFPSDYKIMSTKLEINEATCSKAAYWAFMTIVSAKRKDKEFDAMLKACERSSTNHNVVTIDLKINGQEFDFLEMVENYQKQMSRMIAEKAAELLTEKIGELDEKLYDAKNAIADFERELKRSLGVKDES
jgi:hypothetical protein